MSTIYLMRGLPGSGKSTKARSLGVATIVSADDFFMRNGVYEFDATKLGEAHAMCRLTAKFAMAKGLPVVVDNTNCSAWEMRPYVEAARAYGYAVAFVEADAPWAKDPAECARRNAHGVPLAAIERMLARWDAEVTEEKCLSAVRP